MFDALLISQDERLITELQTIAAVTQCALEINSKVNNSEIRSASTVLIDASLNIVIDHPNVVLITNTQPGTEIWQKAVATSAKYVAFLPDAREWLLENLIPRKTKSSIVIGILGASGGLGSSLIASAIAAKYAEKHETVLAELPNFSGGLDVLWGIEEYPGTRWSDLVNSKTRVSSADLIRTLPTSNGVSILSIDSASKNEYSKAIDVISELASSTECLVLDLPNPTDSNFLPLINLCTQLVLIVGSTIKSTNAANQIISNFSNFQNSKLIVRTLSGTGLLPQSIAKTLGLTLAGQISSDQKIVEFLDQGLSPAQLPSSGYQKSILEIFENLDNANASAVA